ncbi:hypothetical protein EPN90_02980 [Patescibacteria group bacterium]|nr:MAG: hypothetical protein EPN90_02980 [Patescibacteria group bacterium]
MAILEIFDRRIGAGEPVLVMAEIGVNHQGKLDLAHRLIDAAADAGVDVVKFQKRSLSTLYQEKLLENPNLGEQAFQYLLPILREAEFGENEFRELMSHARSRGVRFLCTPFDEESVDFLERLGVVAYKVASADLTNNLLLQKIARAGKPMLVSTAMATSEEIQGAVDFLRSLGARFALLHCVAAYPAPPEDLNLRFITELERRFPEVPIGYSGHERGIACTLAAVSLGAAVVERHITLDRSMEGPDHAASLEPDDFRAMVAMIREIDRALGVPQKILSHMEQANRKVLAKSLVAAQDIAAGTVITRELVAAKSPAKGLPPYRLPELLGRRTTRAIPRDSCLSLEDFGAPTASFARPDYRTPWALKTRFSEIDFAEQFEPPMFEFHLSDKDIDEPFVPKKHYRQRLFAHAPDYMGRRVKDLASLDDDHWERSIAFCQQVIDKVHSLAPFFEGPPALVIHVGGASMDPVCKNRERLLARSLAAFRRLRTDGIILLPENLPPHGWYFSGQWFNHIFAEAEEVVNFARELGLRICFDTAHARLACNVLKKDYRRFVETVAPLTDYVQVSDAAGFSREALQIGEGEIDFAETFDILRRHPGWRWCPEIWEGHLNGYRGFLTALERLKPFIP